jgi:cell wall-associated NlpC family hydrolase
VVSDAQAQLSKPYIWGSAGGRSDFSTDAAGFDCSGFVSYVMKTGFGVDLPAYTGSAYTQTRALGPNEQPRPGDVVFYNMNTPDPHQQHIALYIGDGQIIQAGGTARNVNVAKANQSVGSAPEYRRPTGLDNERGNVMAQTTVGTAAQVSNNPYPSQSLPSFSEADLGMPAPSRPPEPDPYTDPAVPPLEQTIARGA